MMAFKVTKIRSKNARIWLCMWVTGPVHISNNFFQSWNTYTSILRRYYSKILDIVLFPEKEFSGITILNPENIRIKIQDTTWTITPWRNTDNCWDWGEFCDVTLYPRSPVLHWYHSPTCLGKIELLALGPQMPQSPKLSR